MEKNNLSFPGFSVYHRVMIHSGTLDREQEKSIEVDRGAACHYNPRTKRESLKILVRLSTCNCKTVLIDVFCYFDIAGPLA